MKSSGVQFIASSTVTSTMSGAYLPVAAAVTEKPCATSVFTVVPGARGSRCGIVVWSCRTGFPREDGDVPPVSIAAFGRYLPAEVVETEPVDPAVDPLGANPLLRLPRTRHLVARGERAAAMIAEAARPMFAGLGVEPV